MVRRLLPLALLLALAACAPADEESPAPPAATGLTTCTKDQLATRTPGKLTIGTDDPAYEPWFTDNKPENGEGFESAVAYAVADRLGFAQGDVTWVRVPFNTAIAPGPKDFDFDVNQFSITEDRKKAVDFSGPYYLVRQTVIALKSAPIAGATSVSALRDAKLGAQVGTTSYQAITELVKPSRQPQVFNTNDDAKKALQNGQIDGLVVDLPTAFYMTAAELEDAVIVGQLPQVGVPEQFGLVLDKGSPLTGCVTQAVDQLRSAGQLATLEKQWLAQVAGARELT
ncbi:ABC transporter substrate-binding protein [Phytohabitans sp. ZYX-F-186]|uniref:ABC transporter substrate-binding protein n=1 Tax=Phytohabitans maris TaxID=3071409 RepID=A0ABU0ZLS1_9ACTN|nr:ABC transporter substrate-binding protein [Phytohabitans sp. ZYX-F-186]MDQ7907996.1 ABC transporter substrate-binding protein [Phytohabitans sp. ZYX-F-186]